MGTKSCKIAHCVCGSLLGSGGVRVSSSRTTLCDAALTLGLLVLFSMSWSADIIFYNGYEVFHLKKVKFDNWWQNETFSHLREP